MISIEVVYANPNEQIVIPLQCKNASTARTAIEQSGILQRFPDIDLHQQKIGIFGKIVSLSQPLKDGDRVEIYRPLKIDPKAARVERVFAEQKNRSPS